MIQRDHLHFVASDRRSVWARHQGFRIGNDEGRNGALAIAWDLVGQGVRGWILGSETASPTMGYATTIATNHYTTAALCRLTEALDLARQGIRIS